MIKRKSITKAERKAWLPLLITSAVVLIAFSALALFIFRYQINPDGISYIHVAERYAAFDLATAINGYWGPLLSWLLVPFLWVGADPVVSLYIISILSSIATVLLVHHFALRKLQTVKPLPLYVIELTLLLTLASLSLSVLTPDILLSLVMFGVFIALIAFHDRPTVKRGVLLGVVGAALFFTKPVGLLLFLFILAAYAAYFIFLKRPDRRLLLVPLASFALLAVPFCVAISVKYGAPTFSTSSAYNLSLISPTNQRRHTITLPGIYLSADQHGTSVWDDPSYLPTEHWSPLHSAGDLKYYANQVLLNIRNIATYINLMGAVIMVGLASIIAAIFLVKKLRVEALVATTLIAGLVGLYSLSIVEPRHMWPLLPLSFLGILILLGHLGERQRRSAALNVFLAIAIIVFSVTFITPINAGTITPNYLATANALDRYLDSGDIIASDDAGTMYACFAANIQCAGILPTDFGQDTVNYLHDHNVRHLLLNDPTPYAAILDRYYQVVDPDMNLYTLR